MYPVCTIDFAVSPCYPNPFNPSAQFGYGLPRAGNVFVEAFDARGAVVDRVELGVQGAGKHQFAWNAEALPSGVYVLVFHFEGGSKVQRVTLLR